MAALRRARWRLTLDAVAHYPRPGASIPGALAFSPDGRILTYLYSERADLVRQLWALDLATGDRRQLAAAPSGGVSDGSLSREEALRRERQRIREGGITRYAWARDADRLLMPIDGKLFITSSGGEEPRQVGGDEPISDARLTPDGSTIVCVRRGDLWAIDVQTGSERQLTRDAAGTVSNGLAEFIAQEEMGRSEGFWISPDGSWVAYTQVDEASVPVYPIVHQGTPRWEVEEHRYPFAGEANAAVRLGVVSLAGGDTRWLTEPNELEYLARIDWQQNGNLAVQLQSREQRRLELRSYDVRHGGHEVLLVEECVPWVNLHNNLRFLTDGSFVWSSEREDRRSLYVYGSGGSTERRLTPYGYLIDRLVHLDEERRLVYFLGWQATPLERQLYRVGLDDGRVSRLSEYPGFHDAIFSADGAWYALTSDGLARPPSVSVRSTRAETRLSLHAAPRADDCAPGLRPPRTVEVQVSHGVTLHGAIYQPPRGRGPFPTVVSVYGGPHVQMVSDSWGQTVDLRAQYLASRGFLVFKLDNRGSARRGLAFEAGLDRRMGSVEVEDQVAGVNWLVGQGLADPGRVGVYGWSYGGYLTLMCLLKAPDVFRAGVAGAPVAAWDGYDSHYTERYMGTPSENPRGYRAGSAVAHASKLRGGLLLVHGMVDENVHFRHTARMVSALEAAGRSFELLVYPEERHMPRDANGRRYLEDRVARFFTEHLLG